VGQLQPIDSFKVLHTSTLDPEQTLFNYFFN